MYVYVYSKSLNDPLGQLQCTTQCRDHQPNSSSQHNTDVCTPFRYTEAYSDTGGDLLVPMLCNERAIGPQGCHGSKAGAPVRKGINTLAPEINPTLADSSSRPSDYLCITAGVHKHYDDGLDVVCNRASPVAFCLI